MAAYIRAMAVASRRFSDSEYATLFDIQAASAPAQKLLPAPASTTARTSCRADASAVAAAHCASSEMTCSLKALRTSGRLRVRYSTAPSRLVRRYVYDMSGSSRRHEEDEDREECSCTKRLFVAFVLFVLREMTCFTS
jgi:hypothetical protein